MKRVKPKYKIIMIDGYVQKVVSFVSFSDDTEIEDIAAIRSWMNGTCFFISVGSNDILNLRYVKRIKRIWRLRDHLPMLSMQCFRVDLIFFIFWLMFTGYLIIIWN